jgi:hypothetical protein
MNIAEEIAALPEPERRRVQTGATVLLCLRFSEVARDRAKDAEAGLIAAMNGNDSLAIAAWRARAVRALDFLNRTTTTLEQAIRLHALGRA